MSNRKLSNAEKKERIRQRVRVQIDEDNYQFFPERKEPDYYDNDVSQRVGVYARVSTDDPRQTTSYELQKRYYEDFVVRHPKWTLVDIYADEGISGTSTKHRDEFNRMIAECKAGKIDLIITKSVSRFARNVVDFLGMVRMLSERNPPIGVFFEAENIFSLNETSNMALSFQATMAEEESRNKSRSMETSLRMRLDHGLPLTPKLLGFTHNSEGKLIPNPDTKHIPKLMFYMYLYGYSTQQIADALTALEKKTYLGNVKWTASGVAASMRNERYCGDVYTRKRFKKDVLSGKTAKNRGERPISHYYDEHEGIISRDDFIAVQHMLKNSKYGNKSMLPELRVITEGLLKGFVIINPRWSGFREQEYLRASASAYPPGEHQQKGSGELCFEVEAGDFDMRGFEVVHTDLFDVQQTPHISFYDDTIKFGIECIRRMKSDFYVELLIHPAQRKFAVRATDKQNRNGVIWAKTKNGRVEARPIACAAYFDTIYSLFGWNRDHKYRMYSTLISNGDEEVFIFNADEAAAYIHTDKIPEQDGTEAFVEPITKTSSHVMGIPACYTDSFGNDFYVEQTYSALANQTREQWQIRVEGQLCNTGMQLNVTDYDTLRTFIMQELGDWRPQEDVQYEQIEEDDSFSLDKFQVVRREFFSHISEPSITFNNYKIGLNSACIKRLPQIDYIQFLVNRQTQKLAIRPCLESDLHSFQWCTNSGGKRKPRQVTGKIFFMKLFDMMGWNPNYRYKILGKLIRANGEYLFVFDLTSTEVYQRIVKEGAKPKMSRTPVFPAEWQDQFGVPFEEHRKSLQINIFDNYAVYGIKDKEAEQSASPGIPVQTEQPRLPAETRSGGTESWQTR